jgi:hypothetical protein
VNSSVLSTQEDLCMNESMSEACILLFAHLCSRGVGSGPAVSLLDSVSLCFIFPIFIILIPLIQLDPIIDSNVTAPYDHGD